MQNLTTKNSSELFTYLKLFSYWRLVSILFLTIPVTSILASEQAANKTDVLLAELKSVENDTLKADILMQIALEQYYINTQEAIRYGNLALNTYQNTRIKKGIGRSNNLLGAAYFSLGEYKHAELYYNKAFFISSEIGDTLYISKSLNNLGNVSQKLGKLDKAIDYYIQSICLYKATNNKIGEIGVTNNIASIYRTVGNLEKSIDYYTQAQSLAEELNNKNLLSSILHNLAAIYTELEDYEAALDKCTISYRLRKELNLSEAIIKSLISYGNIYSGLNDLEKAQSFYSEALALSRKTGYMDDEAYTLLHLGYIGLLTNDFNKARKYFAKGLSVADTIQDLQLQQDFHKYLYTVDSTTGNFKSAFLHLQTFNKLKSTNAGLNLDNRITELQTKYDLTRQENIVQTAALKRNRIFSISIFICLLIIAFLAIILVQHIRLKTNRQISKLTQENLRSQINPHFIFNVLNSIHAFILTNDKDTSGDYLLKFAKLLRLTLDNSQTKLTTIYDEVEALKLYLDLESMRFKNKFEYKITIDEEIDPYMFKIPPLLIQPYVENSILHGLQNKEGKGKIEIALNYENNHIHCSIADNGIGRKKAMEINSLKTTKRKSYGTKITENRLKLLNSFYGKKMNMSYSDLLDDKNNSTGTKVEFNLPILN